MIQNKSLLIRSEGADVKEMWRTDATPLRQFLDENCQSATDNDFVYTEDLFAQIQKWVDASGISESEHIFRQKRAPATMKALSQAMLRYGYNTRLIQKNGKRKKAYMGLLWIPSAPYSITVTKNGRIF